MEVGSFSKMMKQADIIPIHKGGKKDLPINYCPISLLPTISKILEKIIYKQTYNFLEKNNFIYQSQYGFRSNHSCKQAVSEMASAIIKGKENNKDTLAVFLDLSKAFDTLDHKILLKKTRAIWNKGNYPKVVWKLLVW